MGRDYWWGPMGDHMWFSPMIMPILFLLALVLILYFFFGKGGTRPPGEAPGQGGDSALDILKKRYARGEITKEEYEQIKKDLLS